MVEEKNKEAVEEEKRSKKLTKLKKRGKKDIEEEKMTEQSGKFKSS